MNLNTLPEPIRGFVLSLPQHVRDAAPIAGGVAAIVAFLAAIGIVIAGGTGGSLGSSGGGGVPPATTAPLTSTAESTSTAPTTTAVPTTTVTEPTTTVPTTTPSNPVGDFTVTAFGTPGSVTVKVNGTATDWSLVTLNYDNGDYSGMYGNSLVKKGPYEFTTDAEIDASSPSIKVRVQFYKCEPNWFRCDSETDKVFTRTVEVDYR